MNQTETFLRNLRVIVRSERILARSQFQLASRKLVLGVVAGIAALFALGLLNIAAYFALELEVSRVWAALILGAANLVIAAIVAFVTVNLGPGQDAQLARDFRDMAVAEIENQVSSVEQNVRQLSAELSGLGETALGLVKSPSQLIAPGVAIAAITAITKLLKSGKKSPRKRRK
jgi:hypothetical protein